MEYFDPDLPFFKGNLHMHTTGSDGRLTLHEAEEEYLQRGYDFIAVTDHRVWSTGVRWHGEMLVLPGIELDYSLVNQVVHMLGIGVGQGIQAEVPRILGPQAAIHRIHAHGGLAILAHPAWSLNTVETILSMQGLDGAEIYNAVSAPPFNGDRADSMALLDAAAANGCVLNTIAADDAHDYTGDQGRAFVRVQARDLSAPSVLEALRLGRYHASCGPAFHGLRLQGGRLHIRCSPVEHIVVLSNLPYAPGRNFHGEGLREAVYHIKDSGFFPEKFLRVILIDAQGRKAWSNPIDLGRAAG